MSEICRASEEKILVFGHLPNKFVAFSSFPGLPVMGFEKEINSLLKKLELRKGRGIKIARGKKKSPLATRLEKEIRKLECSVNYDCAPLSVREGGGAVESVLPPFEVALLFCSLVAGSGVQIVLGAFYVFCCYLGVQSGRGWCFLQLPFLLGRVRLFSCFCGMGWLVFPFSLSY